MQPFLWFLLTLLVAIVYAWRLRRVVGYIRAPLVKWHVAAALATGLIVGTILSLKLGIGIQRDVGVFVQSVTLFVCVFIAMRYWISWHLWDIPAAFIAVLAVAFYYVSPVQYINAVLCLAALGIGAGGYFVTKKALKVFVVAMAAFDAYAVWFSDIMEQLSGDPTTAPFPGALMVGLFITHIGIGTADLAMGAMVAVCVQRHRGTYPALGFVGIAAAALLIIALIVDPLALLGITWLTEVPFLVILAPITFLFLKRSSASPSC